MLGNSPSALIITSPSCQRRPWPPIDRDDVVSPPLGQALGEVATDEPRAPGHEDHVPPLGSRAARHSALNDAQQSPQIGPCRDRDLRCTRALTLLGRDVAPRGKHRAYTGPLGFQEMVDVVIEEHGPVE